MTNKCPVCDGSGFTFFTGKPKQCVNCSGSGVVAAPEIPRTKILIVGEFYSREDELTKIPFSDGDGRELFRMLEEAGIEKTECQFTVAFEKHFPKGIFNISTSKALSFVPMPPIAHNKYLVNEHFPELERLWKEIEEIRPNIIIALGDIAQWAVTGQYNIRAMRGTTMEAAFGVPGMKVLSTYAPSSVRANWSLRSIVVADLAKAKRQSDFPELRRPSRKIWLEPSINDIELFYKRYVKDQKILSFDIETAGQTQITCVGFAPAKDLAIVIPFVDRRKADHSYWPTAHQEKLAWNWVKRYLEHVDTPDMELLGQNGLYDINWLWSKIGIRPRNYARDTMLKHHAINPEYDKGLGFLGSIYTEEPAWKTMRTKFDSTKRGE